MQLATKKIDFIELHPTNVCNLNCSGCTYAEIHSDKERRRKFLPFDALDKIAQLNPSEILIVGGGEPTIYQDQYKTFNDLVLKLKKLMPDVDLYPLATNGTYIPEGAWQNEISSVRICLHDYTKENFDNGSAKIRNRLRKVWNNIFEGYFLKGPIRDVRVTFVFSKDNYLEIPGLAERLWDEWQS